MHFFKKPRIFYGYWIVIAAFFCLFLHSGLGFYAFSLFVSPLQAEFGWSRGAIMVAFTVYLVAQGIASPFVGRIVDRYGAGKLIAIGAIISGLSFVLLSQTRSLWYFYIIYAIYGIGHVTSGHVPASVIVSNWFNKRRGTAMGMMSTGIGAGGFAIAPFIGGYILPTFGWKGGYIASALLTWIVTIPLALFVLKSKPADMGLYPDGVDSVEAETLAKASYQASGGLTPKVALATSAFWLMTITLSISAFSQLGIVQNQVPYLEDIGFPVVMAATALGTIGLGSLIGKFIFGWLCDHIPPKYACAMGCGLMLVGASIIMNVGPSSSHATIWIYAIVMGLGIGSWLPTSSLLTSTNFGLGSYGAIWGLINGFHGIIAAMGPMTMGYIYDTTGSYDQAFIIALVLLAISIVTILLVRRPKSL
ncbi:MFS transporter [Chloroflexota bacterium]